MFFQDAIRKALAESNKHSSNITKVRSQNVHFFQNESNVFYWKFQISILRFIMGEVCDEIVAKEKVKDLTLNVAPIYRCIQFHRAGVCSCAIPTMALP